jgi:hypothetical protein
MKYPLKVLFIVDYDEKKPMARLAFFESLFTAVADKFKIERVDKIDEGSEEIILISERNEKSVKQDDEKPFNTATEGQR